MMRRVLCIQSHAKQRDAGDHRSDRGFVGNQVVTASEIRRELQMTAFLNGTDADFGADARRGAIGA
jgi:hypothetical protein